MRDMVTQPGAVREAVGNADYSQAWSEGNFDVL